MLARSRPCRGQSSCCTRRVQPPLPQSGSSPTSRTLTSTELQHNDESLLKRIVYPKWIWVLAVPSREGQCLAQSCETPSARPKHSAQSESTFASVASTRSSRSIQRCAKLPSSSIIRPPFDRLSWSPPSVDHSHGRVYSLASALSRSYSGRKEPPGARAEVAGKKIWSARRERKD